MPFIDGETLRDKLNRETQLAIDEAVKITTDVADALDCAHRHNVIHRDIKKNERGVFEGSITEDAAWFVARVGLSDRDIVGYRMGSGAKMGARWKASFLSKHLAE